MLIEVYIGITVALIAAALSSLLVTRITEKPIRIPFGVLTESAANTFTTQTISVASVPSISVTRGQAKGIGIEVMKVFSEVDPPDPEDDQQNSMQWEISKGAAPTAMLSATSQRAVWRRQDRAEINFTTSGSSGFEQQLTQFDDLTDGDGNGELVFDNQMHFSGLGTGNATTKSGSGYMLVHLIEFSAEEAIFEVLEQAS